MNYKVKIDCKFLKSIDDKILNFKFITSSVEEISRTLFMDYNMRALQVNKYGLYNDSTSGNYRFLHQFLLNKEKTNPEDFFIPYSSEGLFFHSYIIVRDY